MTTLPTGTYIADTARTVSEVRSALSDLVNFIKERLGGSAETELTISSGQVTPTLGTHSLDTEGDAATDDLTNIVTTNLVDGSLLLVRAVNSGDVVTLKHLAGGAGQMALANGVDAVLSSTSTHILLRRSGTDWVEVFRSGTVTTAGTGLVLSGGGTTLGADIASQAEAEAGTSSTKMMTPERAAQAIAAKKTLGQPYDIPFMAGWGGDMAGENLEVRAYGAVILPRDVTVEGESGYLTTVSSGSAVIVDVERNGSSIYGTKPQHATGATALTAGTISTTNLSAGDRLTFKVTQKGSSTAGQKLLFALKAKTR